jgi:hypothetical protein
MPAGGPPRPRAHRGGSRRPGGPARQSEGHHRRAGRAAGNCGLPRRRRGGPPACTPPATRWAAGQFRLNHRPALRVAAPHGLLRHQFTSAVPRFRYAPRRGQRTEHPDDRISDSEVRPLTPAGPPCHPGGGSPCQPPGHSVTTVGLRVGSALLLLATTGVPGIRALSMAHHSDGGTAEPSSFSPLRVRKAGSVRHFAWPSGRTPDPSDVRLLDGPIARLLSCPEAEM